MASSKVWLSKVWLTTAALVAGGLLPTALGVPFQAPTVVGVVDIDRALEGSPKMQAERERLDALRKGHAERLEALDKQLEQMKRDLGLMKRGSDQAEMAALEIKTTLERGKLLQELFRREMDVESERGLIALYSEAERATAEVAKLKGVQVVLRMNANPSGDDLSKDEDRAQQQRLRAYDRRTVWFSAEEVDLTAAVAKYLKVLGEKAPAEKPAAPAKDGSR
ncbi:MAG: OmpH family outer membrane protein [Planctomycetes bacterium]|nr:OmpH family outer membrane protein [Planctomycetota bacterium]